MTPASTGTLAAAIATTLVVWGTSFACLRVALPVFSPGQLSFLRYLIASLALLAIVPWTRPSLPRRDELGRLVVVALAGVTVYNLLLTNGLITVGAGPGAFINNSIPLFSTLCAILLLGERPGWVVWMGMAVCLGGVALIAIGESDGRGIAPGAILLVGSAISYAVYTVVQKPLLTRRGPLWVVSWAIWIGTAFLLPWAPGACSTLPTAPVFAYAALTFLGLLTTALGFVLWSWCLQRVSVSRLSPVLYIVPVISLVTAWSWLGERPSPLSLSGCVVVVGGVLLATRILARGPVLVTS
jgi:drug/metabolite transporter (DMT)-like permease